jgi:arabinose-5-phosphate isomerase
MRRIFTNLDYATHFQAFVSRIITCRENRNRVFTSGIGKSGIVAKRFASMLSSLSIPSHWIHGSEWTHGELGNLFPGDVVILISNSGKTPELLHLPEVFHGFNVDVMCVVGGEESPLYKQCDYKIFTPAKDCLFDSVPTRSIVAQEAICNAVAESVVSISGIKPSTFKKNHPGGNIGHMMFSPPPRRNSHPTTHHNL